MAFSSVDTYAGPSKLKYGKYGNRQFYYCMSPYKNLRVEKSTKTMANQKNLDKVVSGTFNLVCCFLQPQYTVPITIFANITTPDEDYKVKKQTYSTYVFQFTYRTRQIYTYKNKVKRVCLEDEIGTADVFYEFHPVGTGWTKSTYSYKIKSNLKVYTPRYYNKQNNLVLANSAAIRNYCKYYRLKDFTVSDKLVRR